MRLVSLEMIGFRGIAELSLAFDPQLTVIVGENGIGKTSILDALSILLDQYIARFVKASPQGASQIKDTDMIQGARRAYPATVLKGGFDVGGPEPIHWTLVKQDRTLRLRLPQKSDFDALNQFVKSKVENDQLDLKGAPLLAYYGQRRAVLEFPQRLRDNALMEPESAFDYALEAGKLNYREFVAWFRDRTLLEFQLARRRARTRDAQLDDAQLDDAQLDDAQLDAVRQAITRATGFKNPQYRMEAPKGFCVTKPAHRLPNLGEEVLGNPAQDILRVDQLSSGEKTLIAIFGDLARRLAMLNPDNPNPLDGKGIVLVDEVELHLHPRWQRKFLPLLLDTFRNCQFIVTTHSPQVLGEVAAERIRVLRATREGPVEAVIPRAAYGRDSNYILLSILGADERDTDLKMQLDALDEAVGKGDLTKAEELLATLRDRIEGAAPELTIAEARMDRRRRQSGRGQ